MAESYTTVPNPEPVVPVTSIGRELQSLFHIDLAIFFADIKQIYARVMEILLILGILGFAVGYSFKKNLFREMEREYVALSLAGVGILIGQTILPSSAIDYGIFRLFQQNLIFLALPIILGLLAASTILTRNRTAQLLISSGVVLFFFVILSGFFPQFTGGGRPPLTLNNYGFYYEAYDTHGQEISAFHWMDEYATPGIPVQSDHYFSNIKMITYAGIAPVVGLLPETIEKKSYVYLNFNNVTTGNVIEYINGNVAYYQFPLNFLENNKSLIYNNGGSEIYR